MGLSAATKLGLSRGLDYLFGYDFQQYKGRDEVLLIEEQKESVHAVYAQVRSTDELSASTHFTAGLRYNHAEGSDATVWSLSGVHKFSEAFYIEGSVGTSFQLPDIYELYAIDPFDTRGNPDLKPEESLAFNLAIGGQFTVGSHALAWQVSGWDRSIDNLIVDDDTNPPPGFDTVFINIDEEVKVTGAELLLRGPITDAWSFDASYMYSREHARGTSTQLDNRPLNSAKLGVTFAPVGGRFGADLALKYFGDTRANVTGFGVQHYGDDIIANLGAHFFADAAGHHRIGIACREPVRYRIRDAHPLGRAGRLGSHALHVPQPGRAHHGIPELQLHFLRAVAGHPVHPPLHRRGGGPADVHVVPVRVRDDVPGLPGLHAVREAARAGAAGSRRLLRRPASSPPMRDALADFRIEMLRGEPVLRQAGAGTPQAAHGNPVDGLQQADMLDIADGYARRVGIEAFPQWRGAVPLDQWTIQTARRNRPRTGRAATTRPARSCT